MMENEKGAIEMTNEIRMTASTYRFQLLFGCIALAALMAYPVDGGEIVPAFDRLSLGEIKPAGWLRNWCETARDGYTGNMEDVHVDYKRALNPDYRPQSYNWHSWKRDPATGQETPVTSFYCAEAAAYWFPGLIRLAYQLDDPKLKEIVRRRVDPYLPRITTNTVGFAFWLDRNNPVDFKLGAVWQFSAVSQFARGLVDYYSVVRDERILIAAERMVDDPNAYRVAAEGDHYLGLAHAAYDIMQFRPESSARAAFEDYCLALTSEKRPSHCYRFSEPLEKHVHDLCLTAPNHGQNWQHGVIAHEEMLSYLCVYLQTGDRRLLDNLLAWREYLDAHCRQPHGAPVSDEFFGAAGGARGTETCDVMSDLASRCEFLVTLGDGRWGDDAERNFFNAVPACVSRDFTRHCYFQSPNMTRRDQKFAFSTGSSSWCTMTRDRDVLCCASNTNRLLPEYIRYSWLRPREGGLAAALWCPCDISTKIGETEVKVRVRTDYPFGDTIAVMVDPSVPSHFPLRLRIPAWCANPAVSVNGERIVASADRGFVSVDRIWKVGDRIDLAFPMTLRLEGGVDRNTAKEGVRWNSVFHGPLLYALGVPEKDENTPADSSFRTDYRLDPKTALALAKVVRKPMPAKWNWSFDAPVRIEDVTAADGAQIALIPYGCTRLRMTMFPESASSSMSSEPK